MKLNIIFIKPWYPIGDEGENLSRELMTEIGKGHILYGMDVTPIARRHDSDDVLFLFGKEKQALAVVHLTWSSKRSDKPAFPHTTIYADIDEWVETCMLPDSQQEG